MTRRSTLWLLTLILLFAALLRIYNLTQQSLWLDEGFTYYVNAQADMFPAIKANTQPPLYHVLLRLWTLVAGDSIVALRFFSTLPSILTVAVVFQLARLLVKDRSQAAVAAIGALSMFLLALSDPDIFLAQETRSYGWRTLLVSLNAWAYLLWLRRPTRKRAFWWVISSAALPYLHYLAVYLPLVEGLHALIYLRGTQRRQAILLLVVSAIPFLPWFFTVTLDQMGTPPDHEMLQSLPSNLDSLLELATRYFTGQWTFMIALALLGTITLVYGRRSIEEQVPIMIRGQFASESFFLASWVIVPVAVTFVANFWFPLLMPRNPSLITPAIAILIARGLYNIPFPIRRSLLIAIVAYGLLTVNYSVNKPPWDEVGADAARYATPGSAALMEVTNGGYPLGYYLDHWMPAGTPVRSIPLWRETATDFDAELADFLADYDTVWLAAWGDDQPIYGLLDGLDYVPTAVMTTVHVGNPIYVYRYDQQALFAAPVGTFASGMRLDAAALDVDDGTAQIDLWWSAAEALTTDYTVSAFLLDEAGQLVAQYDAYPFANERPTTAWTPGEIVYDPHPIPLDGVPPGDYQVGVKVYTWADGQVFPAEDGADYLVVGELRVS